MPKKFTVLQAGRFFFMKDKDTDKQYIVAMEGYVKNSNTTEGMIAVRKAFEFIMDIHDLEWEN